MNFDLTEDRQMLADTLRRYLAEQYDIETRNKLAYDAPFHSAEKWSEMAELGIAGALVTEENGGFGGQGFDISVVFEALGRTLCPEPFLGALMASRLLGAAGADQESLVDGSVRYAVGISEIDAPYDVAFTETTATATDGTYVLNGRKSAVYGGQVADVILVVAKLDGKLGVFSVKAADANVVGYAMIDGAGAAELVLDNTPAELVLTGADAAIQDALNAGRLALCAEAVGAMEATYEILLDYLKTRKQFGVAIGKFQVLQHRTVDLLTEIEQSRSMVVGAAAALGDDDAALKIAMAKNLIGRAARQVAEEAIQMHGGIAMTWEYAVSHLAKRLIMLDHQLGDTDHCLTEVMNSYAA
ncbi:acyl-CoA dehydrogenase family protein [Shimia biformata]|uniref:acyl-CoA dehydrogenase family protein n=1 Tax=Shimia biformata TaxID=1294299 RepID=UPI001951D7FE|nr:acyl-CoA dehydrogenase family protein [Shimia biformata]